MNTQAQTASVAVSQSIAPVQIDLAYEYAKTIDANPALVAALNDGILTDKKARTSWIAVLNTLAAAFGDKLATFPVPNSEAAVQIGDNEWLPADKWERQVITTDGAKQEKGSFYKSLFLATSMGKAIVERLNGLESTIPDARERKSEKSEHDGDITSGVKLIRRAMNVQHQVWRIAEMAPNVTVRFLKKRNGDISMGSRNIEIVQTGGGDKEIIGKGDVLGYSAFVRLNVREAFDKRANIAELVTVLDLLETNTRGSDEEETEGTAANNYPAPNSMGDFENLAATFANFAEKLGTAEGTKRLHAFLSSKGADDFLLTLSKVNGFVFPIVSNLNYKKRIANLEDGSTEAAA